MKEFFLKHYYLIGFAVFLLITFGGSAIGMFLGVLVVTSDSTQPQSTSDPHDGAAMASVMIFNLAIMLSLISGVLAGLLTTYFLQKKQSRSATNIG